jgi:protease-4
LRETVSTSYEAFKQRVRDGRSLSEEQLEPMAGGRVWTGQEAWPMGLIDELGGLPAAVARARNLAQLPADPRAPLLSVSPGSGRQRVPPQPFPAGTLLDLLTLPDLLEEVIRPRLLAALPWVLEE